LIGEFIDRNVDGAGLYRFISGSTVDAFVNDRKSLFPFVSDYMNAYITQRVKDKYVAEDKRKKHDIMLQPSKALLDFRVQEMQVMYPVGFSREISVCSLMDLFQGCATKAYHEIHATDVVLQDPLIDNSYCNISKAGHYLKCNDVKENTVIIDLDAGEIVDENADDIAWSEGLISLDGSFPMHEHETDIYYLKRMKAGLLTDVFYIYRRPTFYSRLCQIALSNSMASENKEYKKNELNALLASKIMLYIPTFVKQNVKKFAEKALQDL